VTESKPNKVSSVRQSLGQIGERLAADALERRGYCIIQRNFRCRYGEIDLVTQEGEDLVFVEVKTRRGTVCGLPEEAITVYKARKLQTLAGHYLDLHQLSERSWRIDVVAVQFSPGGRLEEIRVYQHAIMAYE